MADGTQGEVAPYQRVAAAIRARIADGTWPPDHKLPSRSALGAEFGGVGDNVVRRAQEVLIAEGLLEGRAGSGTYVRAPGERRTLQRIPASAPEGSPVRSGLAPAGFEGTWEAESEAKLAAPPEIAARLGIAAGDHVVKTVYEYLDAGHRPVMVTTSWELMALTGGSVIVLPEGGPLAGRGVTARMAHIGITVTRAEEVVRPIQLDRGQAKLLAGATLGSLATLIERTHYATDGRPVETADILVPADRWDIAYTIPLTPDSREN
ncbi:GntR family transcriptional regulator [Streptomyces noursei]|uniref:GntR family transcriptional regulator n=1 Tax=Streptomyces noursei TaxID=1971 RepID=UPI001672E317|nr:GntR family transcriptional regulator [Streptomyces noursei]MCZ1021214.1 GntR family transcriptional regulator [Streptomyces noursei]GGX58474.1 GntR family transcriptional regulator [Streptomyces noursei]